MDNNIYSEALPHLYEKNILSFFWCHNSRTPHSDSSFPVHANREIDEHFSAVHYPSVPIVHTYKKTLIQKGR